MPYRDKDGRVKHVKKIGEEVPEWRPEGRFTHSLSQFEFFAASLVFFSFL